MSGLERKHVESLPVDAEADGNAKIDSGEEFPSKELTEGMVPEENKESQASS
jgi:hypothetical protein